MINNKTKARLKGKGGIVTIFTSVQLSKIEGWSLHSMQTKMHCYGATAQSGRKTSLKLAEWVKMVREVSREECNNFDT